MLNMIIRKITSNSFRSNYLTNSYSLLIFFLNDFLFPQNCQLFIVITSGAACVQKKQMVRVYHSLTMQERGMRDLFEALTSAAFKVWSWVVADSCVDVI